MSHPPTFSTSIVYHFLHLYLVVIVLFGLEGEDSSPVLVLRCLQIEMSGMRTVKDHFLDFGFLHKRFIAILVKIQLLLIGNCDELRVIPSVFS